MKLLIQVMSKYPRNANTLLLLAVAALPACDWVDSTGKQGVEIPSDTGIANPPSDFESSDKTLQANMALGLLENTSNRIQLDGADSALREWRWELVDDSNTELCTSVSGFDAQFSESSLNRACANQTQCTVGIEEFTINEQTVFSITLPKLKAPVALSYLLAAPADGVNNSAQRTQTICGLSVNEAPAPGNDNYTTLAGTELVVLGSDPDSLISNDFDDNDVRNQPLQVDTTAVMEPRYAEIFTIQSDGGFFYKPMSNLPISNNRVLLDTFVYSVGDGLHQVSATATIAIGAENTAPVLIATLPFIEIDINDNTADTVIQEIDVSNYFTDLDGDSLSYELAEYTLPDALIAEINEQGILSISQNNESVALSAGAWSIEISTDDGIASINTVLLLSVTNSAEQNNRPPTARDIRNLAVEDDFEYDVSVFFDDPDDDELTFSSDTLPPGVQLSLSGVISGTASRRNDGRWIIRVTATDTYGETVSDAFALTID